MLKDTFMKHKRHVYGLKKNAFLNQKPVISGLFITNFNAQKA